MYVEKYKKNTYQDLILVKVLLSEIYGGRL